MLEVNPNETMSFLDAFTFGGQTALIGMITIFTVLVIIWGALTLFRLFLYDIPNKKKIEEPAVTESKAHPNDEVINDSSEIVAVIAAAIAAAEADSNGAKFKVVSFRRKR
jgi:hypothetical protein